MDLVMAQVVALGMVQVVSDRASVVSDRVVSGRVVSGRVAGWVVSEVSVEDRECAERTDDCSARNNPRVNFGS